MRFGDYCFGFNGKEADTDGEWGAGEFTNTTYDYGFRIYNPSIGKFLSVDPLAHEYAMWSPYTYVIDKPILFVDPDGRDPGDFIIVFTGHQLTSENQPTTALMSNVLSSYTTGDFAQFNSSNYHPDATSFVEEAFS